MRSPFPIGGRRKRKPAFSSPIKATYRAVTVGGCARKSVRAITNVLMDEKTLGRGELSIRPNVRFGSRLCKNTVLEVGWYGQVAGKLILCSDRFHQSANAQNAHYPFHVVGEDVRRLFGPAGLERSRLEGGGPHPGFYRPEGVPPVWGACAHLSRFSTGAHFHRLKDGFVLPA